MGYNRLDMGSKPSRTSPIQHLRARWLLVASLAALLSACNLQRAPQAGTVGPQGSAAPTEQGGLTQAALGLQTQPADSTGTPIPALTPGARSQLSSTGSAECENRAGFIADVTMRDNSEVQPGEPFAKVWRLRNNGTCTWTPAYTLAFVGGDRMSAAASQALDTTVAPGQPVDVAIDMVAPSQPGTYQGYWRLRDERGSYFGIGPRGDQSFWVKIRVPAPPTVTGIITSTPSLTPAPTMGVTPEPSPSAGPGPVPYNQGSVALDPMMGFDLDSGVAISPEQGDITYERPEPDQRLLVLSGGAVAAPFSPPPDPPEPADCQALPHSQDPIPLAEDQAGMLICYRTDQGRPGYLRITSLQDPLELDFTTWVP